MRAAIRIVLAVLTLVVVSNLANGLRAREGGSCGAPPAGREASSVEP